MPTHRVTSIALLLTVACGTLQQGPTSVNIGPPTSVTFRRVVGPERLARVERNGTAYRVVGVEDTRCEDVTRISRERKRVAERSTDPTPGEQILYGLGALVGGWLIAVVGQCDAGEDCSGGRILLALGGTGAFVVLETSAVVDAVRSIDSSEGLTPLVDESSGAEYTCGSAPWRYASVEFEAGGAWTRLGALDGIGALSVPGVWIDRLAQYGPRHDVRIGSSVDLVLDLHVEHDGFCMGVAEAVDQLRHSTEVEPYRPVCRASSSADRIEGRYQALVRDERARSVADEWARVDQESLDGVRAFVAWCPGRGNEPVCGTAAEKWLLLLSNEWRATDRTSSRAVQEFLRWCDGWNRSEPCADARDEIRRLRERERDARLAAAWSNVDRRSPQSLRRFVELCDSEGGEGTYCAEAHADLDAWHVAGCVVTYFAEDECNNQLAAYLPSHPLIVSTGCNGILQLIQSGRIDLLDLGLAVGGRWAGTSDNGVVQFLGAVASGIGFARCVAR